MYIVHIREQTKGAKCLEVSGKSKVACKGAKFLLFTQMHRYSVILFERVKVKVAMALMHLCFGGDSPRSYVKNKVLLFFFGHNSIITVYIPL